MYRQNTLEFVFTNKTGKFDNNGNDKITISNAKASVSLNSVVGMTGTTTEFTLHGLSVERLADLSGKADGLLNSDEGQVIYVDILANDSLVFTGVMTSSVANMNTAPEASLTVNATANADIQRRVARPFSAKGSQDLTEVITAICGAAGYNAAFSGVKGMVTSGSPHFEGSVFDQLNQACSNYGLAMSVSPPGKVEFWPEKKPRDDVVPLISSEYGLIGYPIFSNAGIMFQTQYSSLLMIGRFIEMKTTLPHADGRYKLTSVRHELSTWTGGGSWHSVCVAYREKEERLKAQSKNG